MFKRKRETIEFLKNPSVGVIPYPKNSIKYVPEYFKNLQKGDDRGTVTAKNCVPFVDAMRLGYIIPLWCDIKVVVSEHFKAFDKDGNELYENTPIIEYPLGRMPKTGFEYGGGVVSKLVPNGIGVWCFYADEDANIGNVIHPLYQLGDYKFTNGITNNFPFKVKSPWSYKTPKGWSILFKTPANREHDLYFFEAVVDTDMYHHEINFPFQWVGGEKGIYDIPAGTPLVQAIPFKRKDNIDFKIGEATGADFYRSKFVGIYKTFFWHKRKSKEM